MLIHKNILQMFVQHKTCNTLQKVLYQRLQVLFRRMHRLDLGHTPINGNSTGTSVCNHRDTSPAPTCLAIALVVPSMVPVDTSKFFSSLLMMSFLMFLGLIFSSKKKARKRIRYFSQLNRHTEMWNIHAISMVVSMYVYICLYTQYIAYVENCIPLYLRQNKHENQILRKQLLPPSFSWVSGSPVRTFTLTTAADSKNPSKNHSHPTPIYPQKKRSTHLK